MKRLLSRKRFTPLQISLKRPTAIPTVLTTETTTRQNDAIVNRSFVWMSHFCFGWSRLFGWQLRKRFKKHPKRVADTGLVKVNTETSLKRFNCTLNELTSWKRRVWVSQLKFCFIFSFQKRLVSVFTLLMGGYEGFFWFGVAFRTETFRICGRYLSKNGHGSARCQPDSKASNLEAFAARLSY